MIHLYIHIFEFATSHRGFCISRGSSLTPLQRYKNIFKNQIYLLILCKKLNVFSIYESLENKRITLNNKKPIFAVIVIIRKL